MSDPGPRRCLPQASAWLACWDLHADLHVFCISQKDGQMNRALPVRVLTRRPRLLICVLSLAAPGHANMTIYTEP